MLKVLQEVRRRGLDFVDSRTSPLSVGDGLAAQLGIPHAARDVFLDNIPTTGAILRQLDACRAAGAPAGACAGHRPPLPDDAGGAGDAGCPRPRRAGSGSSALGT